MSRNLNNLTQGHLTDVPLTNLKSLSGQKEYDLLTPTQPKRRKKAAQSQNTAAAQNLYPPPPPSSYGETIVASNPFDDSPVSSMSTPRYLPAINPAPNHAFNMNVNMHPYQNPHHHINDHYYKGNTDSNFLEKEMSAGVHHPMNKANNGFMNRPASVSDGMSGVSGMERSHSMNSLNCNLERNLSPTVKNLNSPFGSLSNPENMSPSIENLSPIGSPNLAKLKTNTNNINSDMRNFIPDNMNCSMQNVNTNINTLDSNKKILDPAPSSINLMRSLNGSPKINTNSMSNINDSHMGSAVNSPVGNSPIHVKSPRMGLGNGSPLGIPPPTIASHQHQQRMHLPQQNHEEQDSHDQKQFAKQHQNQQQELLKPNIDQEHEKQRLQAQHPPQFQPSHAGMYLKQEFPHETQPPMQSFQRPQFHSHPPHAMHPQNANHQPIQAPYHLNTYAQKGHMQRPFMAQPCMPQSYPQRMNHPQSKMHHPYMQPQHQYPQGYSEQMQIQNLHNQYPPHGHPLAPHHHAHQAQKQGEPYNPMTNYAPMNNPPAHPHQLMGHQFHQAPMPHILPEPTPSSGQPPLLALSEMQVPGLESNTTNIKNEAMDTNLQTKSHTNFSNAAYRPLPVQPIGPPNVEVPGNYCAVDPNQKPMPISSGKIYPLDQPLIFNPQNPSAPPIYACGGCHKEINDNDEAIFCESGCNFFFHR